MLVKNNETRFHRIGLGPKATDGFTLKPGVNDVDPALWAKAKEIKLIQWHIDNGTLEELHETTKGAEAAAAPAVQDLSGMSARLATKVVGNTVDRELLERWKASESRDTVTKAIDAQLDRITPPQGGKDFDRQPDEASTEDAAE